MTFKLELMLMDPTQLKQNLIRKVLKILNGNQKQLTPVYLLNVDQGASILLTWVINFVKWNSGSKKYPYGNILGQGASNVGGLLPGLDGSISNNQDQYSHAAPAGKTSASQLGGLEQPQQAVEEFVHQAGLEDSGQKTSVDDTRESQDQAPK